MQLIKKKKKVRCFSIYEKKRITQKLFVRKKAKSLI